MKLKFKFAVVLTACLCLFLTPTLQAAQLTPQQAQAVAAIYRDLLLHVSQNPAAPYQTIAHNLKPLTPNQIQDAEAALSNHLTQGSYPKMITRLLILDRLRQGETLNLAQKRPLLMELDELNQNIQNTQDEIDQKTQRWQNLRNTVAGIGAAFAAPLFVRLHPPTTPEDQAWVWPTFGALMSSGVGSIFYYQYRNHNWHPESLSDSTPWPTQLKLLAKKTDPKVRALVSHLMPFEKDMTPAQTLALSSGSDIDLFAAIPYSLHLLNWASYQAGLGPDNDLDRAVFARREEAMNEPAHPEPAHPEQNPDHVAIEVQQTEDSPLVRTILEKYRSLKLSESDLSRLNENNYQQAVAALSAELKKQPHATWSHVLGRRLYFLSLKRKDPQALLTILEARMGIMMPKFFQLYRTSVKPALMLAVSKNHAALLRFLIHPRTSRPDIFGPIWLAGSRELEKARQLAERRGYTEITQLLTLGRRNPVEPAREPQQPGPEATEPRQLTQTAGHDQEGVRTLQLTTLKLFERYQEKMRQAFQDPRNPETIRHKLDQKLNELLSAKRLSIEEVMAAKAMIEKIEEPIRTDSPNFDPESIYFWNTPEKKARTRFFLALAFLAISDRAAFEQLHQRPISQKDLDDNWVAWIRNALIDSEAAYSIDQGNSRDPNRPARSASCIPGVEHRIIHGLSGLHPDVHIDGGNNEDANLRLWKRRQEAYAANREAAFYKSVFNTLVQDWVKSGAALNPDQTQFIKDYQNYVVQKASAIFGEDFVKSPEFARTLDTITDYPEKIMEAAQETK